MPTQFPAGHQRRAAPAALSRRALLAATAGATIGATIVTDGLAGARPALAAGPILKPLPPELFTVFGTNAEMRWEAMRDQGYHTPTDRFFVRNHTATPLIDATGWRLNLYGSGLRGGPTAQRPVQLSYRQLRRLPAAELSAFIECAGNGRSSFTSQQGQPVSGTAWGLGAVGVARWRGVRLSTVLRLCGIRPSAVSVMPTGLDDPWVSGGVDLGHVRRPLPVDKAMDDVLLAYEMNGELLPPDHGFPVRLVVPNWIGIASIKWVGSIEVSAQPLSSPWDTQFYRLFGPGLPAEGSPPIRNQVVKSAFELPWPATLPAGRTALLTGRSWSGHGAVRSVEVSTDGGASWRRARPHGRDLPTGWLRWSLPWRPGAPGSYQLLARATDRAGHTQPDVTPLNTLGYLFDAVVRHPVTVT